MELLGVSCVVWFVTWFVTNVFFIYVFFWFVADISHVSFGS